MFQERTEEAHRAALDGISRLHRIRAFRTRELAIGVSLGMARVLRIDIDLIVQGPSSYDLKAAIFNLDRVKTGSDSLKKLCS